MKKINLKQFFKQNWQGMVAGAVGGVVLYYVAPMLGYDLTPMTQQLVQTQSVADTFIATSKTAIEQAKTHLVISFAIIGAGVGTIIDYLVPENWWRRRR